MSQEEIKDKNVLKVDSYYVNKMLMDVKFQKFPFSKLKDKLCSQCLITCVEFLMIV